jgi:hypothetical protein
MTLRAAVCTSATAKAAVTEAVSIRPMGGSTRRSGMTSQLLRRTMDSATGLRKFARVHCSSSRSRNT